MRRALLLLCVGCGFQPRLEPTDAAVLNPDVPAIDADAPVVMWAVDGTSKKACPETAQQWNALISEYQLGIAAPNGIWLMQDANGPLVDALGPVSLAGQNATTMTFRQPVDGWTRTAVATIAGQHVEFGNASAAELPDVSTTSMTILIYYATPTTPFLDASILFGGSGGPSSIAEVGIDTANHFALTVGTSFAGGTVNHGTGVVPVVLKLDKTHAEHHLIVDHEAISPVFSTIAASRGLLLGAADNPNPDGRWLYMAAWYGSGAEMSDAQINKLQTALGW